MKKIYNIAYLFLFATLLLSCQQQLNDLGNYNPYIGGSKKINVTLEYPEGYEYEVKAGVKVTVANPVTGGKYDFLTNSQGKATIDLQHGFYRLSITDRGASIAGAIPIFNGGIEQMEVIETEEGDINLTVPLTISFAGQIIIKEIYYRGCLAPDGKRFQYDKYISFYNNSDQIAYLDSVCFGTVEPYNAPTKMVPWVSYDNPDQINDTIPIIEAVWQFPGNGSTFPLQPGEEAVVAVTAAVDHTILRPNSVNLDLPGYFVCYNQRYTNASYHPSPGPNLAGRWLDLLWKQGTATAYPFSAISPAPVIFRIPEVGAHEYVNNPENRSRKPGTTTATEYVMIPSSWVLDGVECFDAATKFKRFPNTIDAGFALLNVTGEGKTLHRRVDVEATAEAGGRVVYMDTNNSENDFEVRDIASIKGN